MSLSDFIELPDVKARFKAEFPKPKLDAKQGILAAAPNGSDVRLVGTAFDYLLRFYIKYQNPHAEESEEKQRHRHFLDLLKSRMIRADHRIQAIPGIPVLGIWKFGCTFHFGLVTCFGSPVGFWLSLGRDA